MPMLNQVFLLIACCALTLKIISKLIQVGFKIDWSLFLNPTLSISLLSVILIYLFLLLLSCLWSKILGIPKAFIFLISPFFIYLLMLVNSLTLACSERVFLLITVFLFAALGVYFYPKNSSFLSAKREQIPEDRLFVFIITLFILEGFFLFLKSNFTMDRLPFGDENTFWHIAAKNMIENGFLFAHQAPYPGGGLHPLSLPFLNAFPGLLLNLPITFLFFMPVFILIGFTLVLIEIYHKNNLRWGMLFLLIAWFASFNNNSWSGNLFYTLIYGESVSMLLTISLLSWLLAFKEIGLGRFKLITVFLLGLLTLTKFPLILLSLAFFSAFLIRSWNKQSDKKTLLLMIIIFFLPLSILKLFQFKFGGVISSLGNFNIDRLFSPNLDMLGRVINNIINDAANLWFYFLIATIAVVLTKVIKSGWPIFLWLFFLFLYYGYLYCYGIKGAGDSASGLRYFLPAAGGILFLGAKGINVLVERFKEQRQASKRLFLYLILLTVIFYKLF